MSDKEGTAFRLSKQAKSLLRTMANQDGIAMTAVLENAIRNIAEERGILTGLMSVEELKLSSAKKITVWCDDKDRKFIRYEYDQIIWEFSSTLPLEEESQLEDLYQKMIKNNKKK